MAATGGKILGIGLSRTGTKSLTAALRCLGYNTAHFPEGIKAIRFRNGQLDPDYDLLDDWQAMTDIPAAAIYKSVDARYPDSRFVLTIRDREEWLSSCERHFSVDRSQLYAKRGLDYDTILDLRRYVYGRTDFSRDAFRERYERHIADAVEYFSDRPDRLLILDICRGGDWGELCAFLQKSVPDMPFPHVRSWKAAQ
jgi:hypothetical protein